jgi:hypothetical protein
MAVEGSRLGGMEGLVGGCCLGGGGQRQLQRSVAVNA